MASPFKKSMKRIIEVAESNTVVFQKEFSVKMVRVIARATPVDTGRATANWKGAVNKEPMPNKNDFDQSPSANKTVNTLKKDISGLKYKDTIIIKNAVSGDNEAGYIIKLENGGSKQAPTGMFRKNVARYKQIAQRTKKELGL